MARSSDSTAPKKKGLFGRKKKAGKENKGPGRLAQIKQVFSMTRQHDPNVVWWMLLTALLIILAFMLLGLLFDAVLWLTLISLPLAVLGATLVLGRRAQNAAYLSLDGQPGASGAVLRTLGRSWSYQEEPVAAEAGRMRQRSMKDLSNAAMVFRAVGKPGVVLITEGPRAASNRLAKTEQRRTSRVLGDSVPVHVVRVGNGEGELSLPQVSKHIKKLPKKLKSAEVSVVAQRMRALGAAKPPVPKGVDPRRARPDRKAMRGR